MRCKRMQRLANAIRKTIGTADEACQILTGFCHYTEAAIRMGQDVVQIPEGEALALRSTRIMGRLRAPSILSMLWACHPYLPEQLSEALLMFKNVEQTDVLRLIIGKRSSTHMLNR